MSETMTVAESDVIETVEVETVDIAETTEAVDTPPLGETIGGCFVEYAETFRKVNRAGELLGQIVEFNDRWLAVPVEGMATDYETDLLAVDALIAAQMAAAAASMIAKGKGKNAKERALSLVTVHTRRFYKFSRELTVAENGYKRAVTAAERAAASAKDKREKLAVAKSGFVAQDNTDIADRKHNLAWQIVSIHETNRVEAGKQLDTVIAQRSQAERIAVVDHAATQADVDTARAAGKPKRK
ncbi:hypothetical protein ACWZHB_01130 [Nocardia sp. FBN12]|uniref:hypothetical protein n=1 Tax=Nocardia sp. FBN12 TaxID=3419766 RepID=UPI003D07460A